MINYSWLVGRHLEADLHGAVTNIFNDKVVTANGFAPVGSQFRTSIGLKY